MIIKRGREMAKRQRNGTWVLFVIFGLSAVVALFMMVGRGNNLTGNVVVGGQECDGNWTEGQWSVCDGTNQTKEWTSIDTITCTSPVIETQSCILDVCDSTHLSLCLTNETCITAIGYWYDADSDGILTCNTEAQPVCGDGIINGNEACDGSVLGNHTCAEQSFTSGSLTCNPDCTLNTGACDNCEPDWTNEAWGECSNGVKTRSPTDNNDCGIEYPGSLSAECSEDTTTETEETETTTTGQVTVVSYPVCTPGQESCANGALYVCNGDGTGWDANGDCPSETVATTETVAESCEDGLKNQDEKGVDCGGVCTKKCSIFNLAGSVVQGPVSNVTAFFNANKTRAYLIIGGVGVLVAGFVAFMVFKKKILSLIKGK